jgi:SAM-dependent methyltransferase
MAIGALFRSLFGPFEHRVSEAYRSVYVDLDAWAERIQSWKPDASRILEIGCGEGALSERLARIYPNAEIVGIDITPRIGRLYRSPVGKVQFLQTTAQEMALKRPAAFDLVILSDVLHHVPLPIRSDLLRAAKAALASGGVFAFKEWERTWSPIHAFGYASDRWITGDPVRYMKAGEMREHLSGIFGERAIASEARIKPWRNNIAFLVRS